MPHRIESKSYFFVNFILALEKFNYLNQYKMKQLTTKCLKNWLECLEKKIGKDVYSRMDTWMKRKNKPISML